MSGPSVQIPTSWLQDDELEDLGGDTVMLMLTALAYCADQTDDGWVARRRLSKLWTVDDLEDSIARLVKAGEVDDQGERVLFINWRDFILPSLEVDRIKEGNRRRAERNRKHKRNDHSDCDPRWCNARAALDARDITRDRDVSNGVSDDTPIRTDPTRTDPTAREGRTGREKAGGAQAGSAGAPPPSGPRIGEGLIAPHEWAGPPDYNEDDDPDWDVRFATPCVVCGGPSSHMVHFAHKFEPGDDPERCVENEGGLCDERYGSPIHTSYDDYLQAKAEGTWWPPQ